MKAHEVVDYLYEKHPALRDEQLAAAIARAERAMAALAQYRAELADRAYEPCVWLFDENASDYVTGCDGDWFDVASRFCPNCGHRVWIAPSDESEG